MIGRSRDHERFCLSRYRRRSPAAYGCLLLPIVSSTAATPHRLTSARRCFRRARIDSYAAATAAWSWPAGLTIATERGAAPARDGAHEFRLVQRI